MSKISTITMCILLLVGTLTMNPSTVSAARLNEAIHLKSDPIKFQLLELEEIEEQLFNADYDWAKLSKREQRQFKSSLKKVSKDLKKTNKRAIKEIGKGIFSRKLIRQVEGYAKNPKNLTPKKHLDITKEIFQSLMKVFPSIIKTQLSNLKGQTEDAEGVFDDMEDQFDELEDQFKDLFDNL